MLAMFTDNYGREQRSGRQTLMSTEHNLKKNPYEHKKKAVKHLSRLPGASVVFASLDTFKT